MPTLPRYAVFGHPIAHSRSPRLHALFAAQTGVALDYTAVEAPPASFGRIARAFFAEGGRGANVTLPDKRPAFEVADIHTAAAQRAGVANVLTLLTDGRIEAHNTDGSGLVRDLCERHHVELRQHNVLLLGAGGAANAVAWALLEAGTRALVIVNRTPAAAFALAARLGDSRRARAMEWSALETSATFSLIVNATSAGVLGALLRVPASLVDAGTIACDLAYGPAARSFLVWAHAAGAAQIIDGLGMLVETAADSFEHWHGVRPETEPAYRTLRAEERQVLASMQTVTGSLP